MECALELFCSIAKSVSTFLVRATSFRAPRPLNWVSCYPLLSFRPSFLHQIFEERGEDAFWSLSWEIAILNDRTKEEERFATAVEATNALSPQKAEILTLDWSQSLCSSERNTTESSNMQTVQCSRILMCVVGTVHFLLRSGVKGDSVSENTTRCLYLPNRLILEGSRLNVHMCFPRTDGFWVSSQNNLRKATTRSVYLPACPSVRKDE